ncbi:MAG: hypothetical protein HZB38_12375 [Planctomycetes bacterium]|nr:hypothetical protein [Planctomycetota bacterium]
MSAMPTDEEQAVATRDRNRRLFWAIEVNLILWLIAMGHTFAIRSPKLDWPGDAKVTAGVVLVGFVWATILQHRAYYSLCRDARD